LNPLLILFLVVRTTLFRMLTSSHNIIYHRHKEWSDINITRFTWSPQIEFWIILCVVRKQPVNLFQCSR
jgi:hypothetical protein